MSAEVTIVILNWNGRKLLEQFLPSVMATRYDNFEVLVVDNASTDDSLSFLASNYPEIKTLPLDRNYGFTEGNNKALPLISTPYYVLLNNDVEVDPGWLAPLIEVLERDETVAAAQPKLLAFQDRGQFEYAGAAGGWIDWLGYPFNRGRLFEKTEKDTGQYETEAEIFWATGACILIRKSVTDRIGLFETDFFAHMEEIDFCWRARNYGYKIMYSPKGVAWHLGGGTLPKTNPHKTFLNARNSILAMIKNFPLSQLWYKLPIRLMLDGVWGMRCLIRGEFGNLWAIVRAHWAIFFRIGYWWKRRKDTYRELGSIPGPDKGYYPHSIVWAHFAKGVQSFRDLPGMK